MIQTVHDRNWVYCFTNENDTFLFPSFVDYFINIYRFSPHNRTNPNAFANPQFFFIINTNLGPVDFEFMKRPLIGKVSILQIDVADCHFLLIRADCSVCNYRCLSFSLFPHLFLFRRLSRPRSHPFDSRTLSERIRTWHNSRTGLTRGLVIVMLPSGVLLDYDHCYRWPGLLRNSNSHEILRGICDDMQRRRLQSDSDCNIWKYGWNCIIFTSKCCQWGWKYHSRTISLLILFKTD